MQPSSRTQGWLMGVVRCELIATSEKYTSAPLGPSIPSREGDDGVGRPDDFWRASAVSSRIGVGAWMCGDEDEDAGLEYTMDEGYGMGAPGVRSLSDAAFCCGDTWSPLFGGWETNWRCCREDVDDCWAVVPGL